MGLFSSEPQHSAQIQQMLGGLDPAVRDRLKGESDEVITKLMKVGNLADMAAAKLRDEGDSSLMDKLVEIAKMKEPPEPPGVIGNAWQIVKSSAVPILTNSLVTAGAVGAVTAGMHYAGFGSSPFVGTESANPLAGVAVTPEMTDQVARNLMAQNSGLTLEAATAQATTQLAEATFKPNPTNVILKRAGIAGVFSAGVQGIMSMFTKWNVPKQEAIYAKRIYAVMNGTGAVAQAGHAHGDEDAISPGNIPHLRGRGGVGVAHV